MGRLVQKGQAPLGAEHLKRQGNVKRRGKMRAQINRLMREQRISRGEAVDIINAERLRQTAEWEARDFADLRERFEEREHRRTIRAITESGDRAERVAEFLKGE